MNIKKWLKQNTKDLTDKTIAITGSTGGLGKEICKHLAGLGAKLVLLNRNKSKTQTQIDELKKIYPNLQAEFIEMDMQNFESVKNSCEKLNNLSIDILILNAGAFNLPRKKTNLRFDNIFQINFVSPYYVTKQLLPQMREKEGSKVVVVGSIAHRYAKLDENNLDCSNQKSSQKVYGNAKRFLMFSLFELFKTEKKVKLAVAHPGITGTNITQNYPRIFLPIIKLGMKLIYMSPKKASLSVVKGIFDETPACTWIGPKFRNIWGYPKKTKPANLQ